MEGVPDIQSKEHKELLEDILSSVKRLTEIFYHIKVITKYVDKVLPKIYDMKEKQKDIKKKLAEMDVTLNNLRNTFKCLKTSKDLLKKHMSILIQILRNRNMQSLQPIIIENDSLSSLIEKIWTKYGHMADGNESSMSSISEIHMSEDDSRTSKPGGSSVRGKRFKPGFSGIKGKKFKPDSGVRGRRRTEVKPGSSGVWEIRVELAKPSGSGVASTHRYKRASKSRDKTNAN